MHPIAFEPFGFTITSFGVMMALAFLFGFLYTAKEARRTGWFREELVGDLLIWLMAGGVLGARLLYVIVHWESFRGDATQIFNLRAGGMVSYGGFLGAFLAGWIFTRRRQVDFVQLADLCLPGALLGQAIGRIGCFLVADDYGRPAPDLPWAVRFPDVEGSMLPHALRGQPLHPTQLYLCLKAFLCFLILRRMLLHREFRGQVLAAAMIVYPIGRSIVEIWRYDSVERGVYAGLSTAQWLSIPLVIAGVVLWFRFKSRREVS